MSHSRGKGPEEASQQAWIRILRGQEIPDELRAIYEEYNIPPDEADNILAIHSADPPTLRGHLFLYRMLMYGRSGLSRPEREMLAVTVSTVNECHY